MKRFIILLVTASIIISCVPAKFVPKELPNVKFEETPTYSIDLSSIPKPEKIKPIFVDKDFKEVSVDKAVYVVLIPKEYAKIAALLKLCKAYKNIIFEQASLVNTHIEIINSLKEYVALERMKAEEYRNLWADSENAYRQEQYNHKLEQAFTKGMFGSISLGAIIALILAL